MYEHPYLSRQITEFENEQMVRRAERERFIAENADRIVTRSAGPFRRMLRRLLATDTASTGSSRKADAGVAHERSDAGAPQCRTAPAR
jgi:hypothetical protein